MRILFVLLLPLSAISVSLNLQASSCTHMFGSNKPDSFENPIKDRSFPKRKDPPPREKGVEPTEEQRQELIAYLEVAEALLPESMRGSSTPKILLIQNRNGGAYNKRTKTIYLPATIKKPFKFSKDTLVHEFTHHVINEKMLNLAGSKKLAGYEEFLCEVVSSNAHGYRYVEELDPATWNEEESHEQLAPAITHLGRTYQRQNLNESRRKKIINAAFVAVATETEREVSSKISERNLSLIQRLDSLLGD